MSSMSVIKSVSHRLRHYETVGKREDEWDSTGVNVGYQCHPCPQRSITSSGQLFDKPSKVYFKPNNARVVLTQLPVPKQKTKRELMIRRSLDEQMRILARQSVGVRRQPRPNFRRGRVSGGKTLVMSTDCGVGRSFGPRSPTQRRKLLATAAKVIHGTQLYGAASEVARRRRRSCSEQSSGRSTRSSLPEINANSTRSGTWNSYASSSWCSQVYSGSRRSSASSSVCRSQSVASDVGVKIKQPEARDYDKESVVVTTGEWVEYRVHVFTGSHDGSGTRAPVQFVMYGSAGRSSTVTLDRSETHRTKFQPGNEDIFIVKCYHLGPLKQIAIGHFQDDAESSWYCVRVEVRDTHELQQFSFCCGRWFSGRRDDRKTFRKIQLDSFKGYKPDSADEDVILANNVLGSIEYEPARDNSAGSDSDTAPDDRPSSECTRATVGSGRHETDKSPRVVSPSLTVDSLDSKPRDPNEGLYEAGGQRRRRDDFFDCDVRQTEAPVAMSSRKLYSEEGLPLDERWRRSSTRLTRTEEADNDKTYFGIRDREHVPSEETAPRPPQVVGSMDVTEENIKRISVSATESFAKNGRRNDHTGSDDTGGYYSSGEESGRRSDEDRSVARIGNDLTGISLEDEKYDDNGNSHTERRGVSQMTQSSNLAKGNAKVHSASGKPSVNFSDN